MEIVEHLKFLVVNMLKQLTTNASMLVRKEGPTKTLLPQEGETGQNPTETVAKLLQEHS